MNYQISHIFLYGSTSNTQKRRGLYSNIELIFSNSFS